MSDWYVYLLRCADDSLYTGITTDLERRLIEHNSQKLGARYTRSRRPVLLVYHEICTSRSEASKREMQIKQLNRQQKLQLINTESSANC